MATFHEVLDDRTRLLDALRERMQHLATAGRYERAAELRSRLHEVARALASSRDRSVVADVELTAWRPLAEGAEVVAIRRGRLAGTAWAPTPGDDTAANAIAQRPLQRFEAPPARDDAEEVALVLAWLARPEVRVVEVEGELAVPHAGGAALHATLIEARTVERAVRRDRQQLAGVKVSRREAS